jgi:DNA-binding transcriptional MocR family regulator
MRPLDITPSNRPGARSPVQDLLALAEAPDVISFAGGFPAPDLFDIDGLRAAFDAALSGAAARRNLQYAPAEGDATLRALIAARMSGHGVPTTADDLLITTGSQQALTLLASTLLAPGSVVAVEEPTYLAALQCFRFAGARLVPVPADDQGILPDALSRIIATERPTVLYLVPTFGNPTGRTMSAERRLAAAELAAAGDLWIIEDDPYGELHYDGTVPPKLASAPAAHERVIYLGSLSKILAPGLRLGWLRAPAALRAPLTVAKQAADLHTSTIDQAAAAGYLTAVDLDARIAHLCLAYQERRDTMAALLPSTMPPGTTWTTPSGGMFIWVHLPNTIDTDRLLPTALATKVAFVPGPPFFTGPPNPATLRLSFTTHPPDRIAVGMHRLATAIHSHLNAEPARRPGPIREYGG